MTTVRTEETVDFQALGTRWRELEARSNGSFFQSWSWVGCLAQERFPNPLLVEATEDGRTVALALFNRKGRRLWLNASGTAALDCPWVEQNGVLAEAGREAELEAACLAAVTRRHDVVLPGVMSATVEAARRAGVLVRVRQVQASPCVDLAALRRDGRDYLEGRSANTRQQIRRSDRSYGTPRLAAAATVAEAFSMLDEMAALHQARWTRRGQSGCFAEPFFGRFHRALIATALPRGEVALWRVSNNEKTIGVLYNFAYRNRMLAYQSGFAYADASGAAKPGLTCHHAAIRRAMVEELHFYDFLAGDDRYKRSLSDAAYAQAWIEAGPLWSPRLWAGCAADAVRARLPARRIA